MMLLIELARISTDHLMIPSDIPRHALHGRPTSTEDAASGKVLHSPPKTTLDRSEICKECLLRFHFRTVTYRVRQASFLFSFCTKKNSSKDIFSIFFITKGTFKIVVYIVLKIISGK
jgi:hypothetical protein